MVMNSIEEETLLGSRRASSTPKKGMFLRQERRLLGARRTCAGFKTYEKNYIKVMLSFIIQTLILLSFQSSAYILMLFISCVDRADDFRVSTI